MRAAAHTFEDLVWFLKDAPMVRACIKELHLICRSKWLGSSTLVRQSTLLATLELLPELRALNLANFSLLCRPAHPTPGPLPLHLNSLTLPSWCHFTSEDVASLLGMFTSVRTLVAERITIERGQSVGRSCPASAEVFSIFAIPCHSFQGVNMQCQYILPLLEPTAFRT